MKGNSISNAKIQRKKLSLKGVKLVKKATFPEKKLPDQKKEDAISRTIANARFLGIYLSTRVIREDVSNLLPPFF